MMAGQLSCRPAARRRSPLATKESAASSSCAPPTSVQRSRSRASRPASATVVGSSSAGLLPGLLLETENEICPGDKVICHFERISAISILSNVLKRLCL